MATIIKPIKRVLLTGAAGFVGSHVAQYLIGHTDFDIVCLIRLGYAGELKRIKELEGNPRVTFVYHDFKYEINQGVRDDIGNIDYILHLGANSNVDQSISQPRKFYEDNVMGTVNILEYMRLYMPNARFINFSTDEVYGPVLNDRLFTEEDRFRSSNPYSGSKVGAVAAGQSYLVTYGLDIITTFTVNIFGAGQNPGKLIPRAIKLAKERKPMPVFAELNGGKLVGVGTRCWLHVTNVGEALVFLLEKGVKGEYYNITSPDKKSNEDVVTTINRLLGTEPLIEYVDFHKTRPGHDRDYGLDGTKLKKLGWEPRINFEEGIKQVIETEK